MATIANLVIKMSSDNNDLIRGVNESKTSIASVAGVAVGAAAGIGLITKAATATTDAIIGTTKALVSFTQEGAKAVDESAKLSRRLQTNVTELLALQDAAELNGVASGLVTRSLTRLLKATGEAASGNREYADTFDDIKIDAVQLQNEDTARSFLLVADAISQLPTLAARTKAQNDLLGRSGVELETVLNSLAKNGIGELIKEVERSGRVLSDFATKDVEDMVDSIFLLSNTTEGFSNQLAGAVAPAVTQSTDAMREALQALGGEGSAVFVAVGEAAQAAADIIVPALQKITFALNALNPGRAFRQNEAALVGKFLEDTFGEANREMEKTVNLVAALPALLAEIEKRKNLELIAPNILQVIKAVSNVEQLRDAMEQADKDARRRIGSIRRFASEPIVIDLDARTTGLNRAIEVGTLDFAETLARRLSPEDFAANAVADIGRAFGLGQITLGPGAAAEAPPVSVVAQADPSSAQALIDILAAIQSSNGLLGKISEAPSLADALQQTTSPDNFTIDVPDIQATLPDDFKIDIPDMQTRGPGATSNVSPISTATTVATAADSKNTKTLSDILAESRTSNVLLADIAANTEDAGNFKVVTL